MTQKQQLQNNKLSELPEDFKRDAIAKIYAGKPLTGKDGIFRDCRIIQISNFF